MKYSGLLIASCLPWNPTQEFLRKAFKRTMSFTLGQKNYYLFRGLLIQENLLVEAEGRAEVVDEVVPELEGEEDQEEVQGKSLILFCI